MAIVINSNIASMNAQKNLSQTQAAMNTSLQRLSSGLRINSAKDDAAGLAISSRFTTQIRGLDVAIRNANDGISMAQTAEGALVETNNSLQRIRELAVQSANASNSASDRASLNSEVSQMISEIDRIATQTNFNGNRILSTTGGFSATFQVGANAGEVITTSIDNVSTSNLGVASNYTRIDDLTGANFAAGARLQNLNGLSSSTLNGATLADVAVGNNGKLKVDSVNASSSGVTAMSFGNALVGTANTANGTATAGGDVVINGVSIGSTAAGTVAQMATAINAKTSETGVAVDMTAGGTMVLFNSASGTTPSSGEAAITVEYKTANASTVLGMGGAAGTTTVAAGANGAVVLNYDVGSGSVAVNAAATGSALAGVSGTTIALTDETISGTNVNDVSSASLAMIAVDFALSTVNSSRASLGAIQNRFESVINSQATVMENLSASRSRIQDADFAKETAEMTRSQILQQAGVSIISQANSLPQMALSLLQ